MNTIDKPILLMLAKLLQDYGVRHIIVSSGSRCAPLSVVFKRWGTFELIPVIDERSAGFVALGISMATNKPVAMVCTSGSAPLNYAPALAEAFYSRIPLIAITADRPEWWIGQREGQTIRQKGCLCAITRKSIDLPSDNGSQRQLIYCNRLINDALSEATGIIPGPVHINVQLAEPLTKTAEIELPQVYRHIVKPHIATIPEIDSRIIEKVESGRTMVIVGGIRLTKADKEAIISLCNQINAVLIAEAQTNIKGSIRPACFDRLLSYSNTLQPNLIFLVGGDFISNRFKAWLRTLKNTEFVSVGHEDEIVDTFNNLSSNYACTPATFFNVLKHAVAPLNYNSFYIEWQNLCQSSGDISNRNAVISIMQELADGFSHGCVHLSNGSAARYGQLINWQPEVTIECNRGVSGIDGCTSTAIGYAIASASPTLLITGDMSAAYDVGALALSGIPANFKIALLDNQGGDIFRNIASTRTLPELDELFVMAPRFPAAKIADAYGFKYFECKSTTDPSIAQFMEHNSTPALLRIIIDPDQTAGLI